MRRLKSLADSIGSTVEDLQDADGETVERLLTVHETFFDYLDYLRKTANAGNHYA